MLNTDSKSPCKRDALPTELTARTPEIADFSAFRNTDTLAEKGTGRERTEANGTTSPEIVPKSRLMYYEKQLQFDRERLPAQLADIPDDTLRELLQELLNATSLCSWSGFPLPCAGLPGFLHRKYDQTDDVGQIIAIGLEYLGAVVMNERRTMHLRWQEARDTIHRIRDAERKACEDRFIESQVQRAYEQQAAFEAAAQFVYFIGAASGPIKIGITANVESRLKSLQTSHHERLSILASRDGDLELEKAYHKRFAARRLNGEWFERCPEIEAEIERLSA